MSLALEDDSTTLDEEDSGTTADEDTGAADEEDSGTTADEDDGTAEEEDSFTLQHVVSGGSSLEDDGLDPADEPAELSWLSPLSMTLDEESSSTEEELSFPEVSGEVDEESSPQATSIAAKDTAIQPAKNFFMKTSYLLLKYKLKSPA